MHLIRHQQPRAAGVPSRQEALTQKSPKVTLMPLIRTQCVSIVTLLVLIMVCVQTVPVVDRKVDYGCIVSMWVHDTHCFYGTTVFTDV